MFRFTRFQLAVHAAALAPLVALIWDIALGNLSVNPIQDITFRTGKAAMVLLVAALAVTPLNTVFGFRQGLRVRRALGLYAFFYAAIHLFVYVVVDYGLDFYLIWLELAEKRYVLVGFAAFLVLLLLALTSTRGWQRRLGKTWKKLHRWIYVAAVLVMLHYAWVQKSDIRQPLAFSALLILLLILRIPRIRRTITRLRSRRASKTEDKGPAFSKI
ncbi:MAG: sulfoxide reductase heme-binding subunit YedZ [Chloroflexi bacterium]|nr:sulfoxide reductase heme-binding subunit YedZ [Chloroflexota bacterium]